MNPPSTHEPSSNQKTSYMFLFVLIGITAVLFFATGYSIGGKITSSQNLSKTVIGQIATTPSNSPEQTAINNNIKRQNDISAIAFAITTFIHDHNEQPPKELAVIAFPFQGIAKNSVNLCSELVPQYLRALPSDPQTNSGQPITDCINSYSTGYQLSTAVVGTERIISIKAPLAENNETIMITLKQNNQTK